MTEDGMDIAQRSHEPLYRRDGSKAAGSKCRLEQGTHGERRRFEDMVSDLSARFAILSLNEGGQEIEQALKQVLEFFQGDRCALLGVRPDRKVVWVTHACYAEGVEHVSGDINLAELFPWSYEILVVQEKHVSVSRMADLPPEAEKDRQSWTAMGVHSSLTIPLFIEGRISSLIAINAIREERSWPEEYVPRLRLLGEIFLNALVRKRAEQALRESEARLSLALDAAETGLWSLDLSTNIFWVTGKTREVFGYASDEEISMDRVIRTIHPDDRDMLQKIIERVLRSGETLKADYRILLPDGSVKWIVSRGRALGDASGAPVSLMGVSLDITERKKAEEAHQRACTEIKELKDRLQAENRYLLEEIKLVHRHEEFVGNSESIRNALRQAEQVAGTDSTVLIQGETGTGKELLAHAIHRLSSRKGRLLVKVNCAALPPTLIESELFGREKGAFTGALVKQIGRFELAEGSTIFLDEINGLTPELQAKLLRVLQNGEFERLGSPKTLKVNVRIIAATNQDLSRAVREGSFREDLYYRLHVFPITVPPLRERKEDILPLVWSFVQEFGKRMGKRIESIPRKSVDALLAYSWPGNVRELRNVIERAMILTTGPALRIEMPQTTEENTEQPLTLEAMEKRHIITVLNAAGWKVSGKNGAADILGINPKTLESRMKKLLILRKQNIS